MTIICPHTPIRPNTTPCVISTHSLTHAHTHDCTTLLCSRDPVGQLVVRCGRLPPGLRLHDSIQLTATHLSTLSTHATSTSYQVLSPSLFFLRCNSPCTFSQLFLPSQLRPRGTTRRALRPATSLATPTPNPRTGARSPPTPTSTSAPPSVLPPAIPRPATS